MTAPRPGGPGTRPPSVALIAASLEILGGHGVQGAVLEEGLRAGGAEVVWIPINPPFPRPLRGLRRVPVLRTVVNQALYLPRLPALGRVDVAHVFSASYWSFLLGPAPAMLVARLFRKRVVLHYHSGEAADHLARWGCLVHPWLRLADAIVVPSEYLRAVFEAHGYRVRVIRNVADLTRFRYRARPAPGPRLLSMRNLEPHYRVDNTLRAFAHLKTRRPDATLVVAGSGSEEGRLRRLAAELGVDGIRFAGRVERTGVPRLYDEADIFVNSSVVDNQPVSVLEAFAAGLPVVSTGTGDIAAMLRHGELGVIVPPDDPHAMAQAIDALLDDAGRARRLAAEARREAGGYAWHQVSAAWDEVYAWRSA